MDDTPWSTFKAAVGGVERDRDRLLRQGDGQALLDLYDDVAAAALGWALRLSTSRRHAIAAVRQAFLTGAEHPEVFGDPRISARGWILLEVHHLLWQGRHLRNVARPGRGNLLERPPPTGTQQTRFAETDLP